MSDLRVVVVGGGRVGLQTARQLADLGHEVSVVERDPARGRELSDEYVATVVEGDGTNPAILEQAGVDRADVFAALTGDAGYNLGACLLSDRLGGPRTVLRVDSATAARSYTGLVDGVVYPEELGARAAVDEILAREVRPLRDLTGDLEIFHIEVAPDAPVEGRTLEEVTLPHGTLVVSDYGGDRTAGPETRLDAGETYIVAVEPDVKREVMRLFRG
ncbi:MAG: TrkA family potassium uptake protein [Haloplanus sp.]